LFPVKYHLTGLSSAFFEENVKKASQIPPQWNKSHGGTSYRGRANGLVDFYLGKANLKSRTQNHDMKKFQKKCRPFFFESPQVAGTTADDRQHLNMAKRAEKKRMPVTRWEIGSWIQPIGKS